MTAYVPSTNLNFDTVWDNGSTTLTFGTVQTPIEPTPNVNIYAPPILSESIVLYPGVYAPLLSQTVVLYNEFEIEHSNSVDFTFNGNDLYKQQPSTDITFIFGEPIPPNCEVFRNGNSNNFDCRCAPIMGETNNFTVSCLENPTDLGFIESYHGSSVTTDIIRTIKTFSSHGEYVSTSLDYRVQKDISFDVYSGDAVLLTTIESNARLISALYSGNVVNTVIDYRPQANITSVIYSGEYSTISSLERNVQLYPAISVGDNFSFNVTTQPAVYFNGTVYHGSTSIIDIETSPSKDVNAELFFGENADTVLGITTTLDFNIQHGESANATINIFNTFNVNAEHGDAMNSTIQYVEPIDLSADAYAGELIQYAISTISLLDFSALYGSTLLMNMKFSQSTGSEFYGRHGETLDATLTSYAFIKSNTYIGENVNSEIDIRQPKLFTATVFNGEEVESGNTITPSFNTHGYYGDELTVPFISTAENTYLFYGDIVSTELASQTSLNNNTFAHGDAVTGAIKYAPSEPLGTFSFAHGTDMYHNISVQISTYFKPKFSFNMEFIQTIWDTTYVDLNKYDCCPPSVNDLLYVNLQRDKEVEVKYDIPHQFSVSTELVATPIFYSTIQHGTIFDVVDYDMLLSANFRFGDNVDVLDLYNDLVVDLNSGNPELDNGDVLIETSKDYTEFKDSFANAAYGSTLNTDLSIIHGLHSDMYIGFDLRQTEFVVESAWRLYFYAAWGLRATLNTNIQIKNINATLGTELRSQFYEEPMTMQIGENVSCHLITEYNVEFIDDGCLDNAHIPTTPDGVPIIDETNEMLIEGHYYSRYIRGRCF